MVLKITNLHIIRHLPTYWLYLLECYTIDNQRELLHARHLSDSSHHPYSEGSNAYGREKPRF